MPRELPGWLDDTPETLYRLHTERDIDDFVEQNIDLTKDEYIELKRHLAKIRGFKEPDNAEEG